jgi:hypothetical protein
MPHPRSFEGVIRVIPLVEVGSGACGSSLINRALGAPRVSNLRAIRPRVQGACWITRANEQ